MAELMLVNPSSRKRRTTKHRKPTRTVSRRTTKSPTRRRRAVAMAPRRRRRSNPVGGKVVDQVMNSAIGAGGALAVDVAMAKLPLPANLTTTPTMRAATQGVVSIGLGMLVSNFGKKRKLGQQLAEGGLTVALHSMGKGLIGPSVGLSGMDDSLLGYDGSLLGYENTDGWLNPAGGQDFPGYADLSDMGEDYYD